MTIVLALPVLCSTAFGAMALLGARPWSIVLALPIVLIGARVIA